MIDWTRPHMIDWTKPVITKNGYSIQDIKSYTTINGREMMSGSISVCGESFVIIWDKSTGAHVVQQAQATSRRYAERCIRAQGNLHERSGCGDKQKTRQRLLVRRHQGAARCETGRAEWRHAARDGVIAMNLYCCGCSEEITASLTDGKEIYPHRPDLYDLPFWKCDICGNLCGKAEK